MLTEQIAAVELVASPSPSAATERWHFVE